MGSTPVVPTAHTSDRDTAATASRKLPADPPGLGLATFAHVVPSQCSVSVVSVVLVPTNPTAHASDADVALTPRRVCWFDSGAS